MKATLVFDLPEDQEDFDTAVKASSYKLAIDEISNTVFRPHRKHGYEGELQELIEKNPVILEAISKLESMFWEILKEYNLND